MGKKLLSKTELVTLSLAFCLSACAPPIPIAVIAASGIMVGQDRRTAGTFLDDKSIALKVRLALMQEKEIWRASHVSVVCFNNKVLLVGQTPNQEFKNKMEEIVFAQPKVAQVFNQVTIGANLSLAMQAQDSAVTATVKTKIFSHKKLGPNRVAVTTEEGVVYLMGMLNEEEAQAAVEVARNTKYVKRVVKIFDILP